MDPVLENEFSRLKKESIRLEGLLADEDYKKLSEEDKQNIDRLIDDFIFFYNNLDKKIDLRDFEKIRKYHKNQDLVSAIKLTGKVLSNIENELDIDSSNILNT